MKHARRIVRLNEFGIIGKLIKDNLTNATRCLDPQNQSRQGLQPLQMADFYGIFAVYLGGRTPAHADELSLELYW